MGRPKKNNPSTEQENLQDDSKVETVSQTEPVNPNDVILSPTGKKERVKPKKKPGRPDPDSLIKESVDEKIIERVFRNHRGHQITQKIKVTRNKRMIPGPDGQLVPAYTKSEILVGTIKKK